MSQNSLGLIHWDRLKCRLLWIYDSKVDEFANAKNHNPLQYSAWLIRKGEVEVGPVTGLVSRIGQGFWVIPPIGLPRNQFFTPETKILSLAFQAEWPDGKPFIPMDRVISFHADSWPGLEESAKEILSRGGPGIDLRQIKNNAPDMTFEAFAASREAFWKWLRAWTMAMQANGCPGSSPSNMDPRVFTLLRMLDGLSFTGRIPYPFLEEAAGLSRVHIDRLFVKETGLTPKRYLEKQVSAKARGLLLATSLPVREIAETLGFNADSHFCAWFKRQANLYPADFRRLMTRTA